LLENRIRNGILGINGCKKPPSDLPAEAGSRRRERSSNGVVLNRLALRPKDGPQTSKPEGWSSSGSAPRRETMPAIASLEDLKSAQKEGVSISLCGRQWD
jgi:hypothetical protein